MNFSVYLSKWNYQVAKMWFYLLFAFVGFCVWWVQNRFKFWEDRGFPTPPSSFPFGTLKGVGTTISHFEANDKVYNMFKGKAPAAGTYVFMSPALMSIDLELLKNIFIRDFSTFHDRGFYYNKEDDPTSAKYDVFKVAFYID